MRPFGVALALLVIGCNFTPLMNRIAPGEEPFVVIVGEGAGSQVDLFAVGSGGGAVTQLTFTVPVERGPRLTTDGTTLAFLRMADTLPGTAREVVVMNLLSGSERRLGLPAEDGQPKSLAWGDDQATLYVRTALGVWALAAPPAPPAARRVAAEDPVADSALTTWLGTPRFARAIQCGPAVCAVTARNDTVQLTPTGRDPFRWGTDSVAWFEGEELMIRPLGPGLSRRMSWTRPPLHPRDGSYARGVGKGSAP